jgi:hypothetical protein
MQWQPQGIKHVKRVCSITVLNEYSVGLVLFQWKKKIILVVIKFDDNANSKVVIQF